MNSGIIVAIIVITVALAAGFYFMGNQTEAVPQLDEGFGILESEVTIDNIYPGWSGTIPFTIVCGKDRDRIFGISIEQPNPNKLKNGYVAFPEEYYPWITVPSPQPISVKAGESKELSIFLRMPSWESYSGKHMEARIRVYEANPTSLVQLAMESRWYIIVATES